VLQELKNREFFGDTAVVVSGFWSLELFTMLEKIDNLKNYIIIEKGRPAYQFHHEFRNLSIEKIDDPYKNILNIIKGEEGLKYFPCKNLEKSRENQESEIEGFEDLLFQTHSIFNNDKKMTALKKIYGEKKVKILAGDICAPEWVGKITEYLQNKSHKVGFYYLSNILEYAEEENNLNGYRESIQKLLSKALHPGENKPQYFIDNYPRYGGLDSEQDLIERLTVFENPATIEQIQDLTVTFPLEQKV
jgi:hypothetical protein